MRYRVAHRRAATQSGLTQVLDRRKSVSLLTQEPIDHYQETFMSTLVILAFVFGLTGTTFGLVAFTQVVALKKQVALLSARA